MLRCIFTSCSILFFKNAFFIKHTSATFPCSSSNYQFPCSISLNNFTMWVADYEGKINYDWPDGTQNASELPVNILLTGNSQDLWKAAFK